nr:hypothetical protein [Pandoravirus massiliensis]
MELGPHMAARILPPFSPLLPCGLCPNFERPWPRRPRKDGGKQPDTSTPLMQLWLVLTFQTSVQMRNSRTTKPVHTPGKRTVFFFLVGRFFGHAPSFLLRDSEGARATHCRPHDKEKEKKGHVPTDKKARQRTDEAPWPTRTCAYSLCRRTKRIKKPRPAFLLFVFFCEGVPRCRRARRGSGSVGQRQGGARVPGP